MDKKMEDIRKKQEEEKKEIRMPKFKQAIYMALSKKQLLHILAEYEHALSMMSECCVTHSKWEMDDKVFIEKIREELDVLNKYSTYDSKELSDECDFRMGKITAKEWRKRRGLE